MSEITRMLTMKEIWLGLEQHISGPDEQVELLKTKKQELETEVNRLFDKIAECDEEIKAAENKVAANKEAIKMAMECLSELGDFSQTQEQEQKEKKMLKEEEEKKNLTWKHKKPHVVKLDAEGNKIGDWISVKVAAKELKCSTATVIYWIKKSREDQLNKRGYILAYEY